jgi:CopG family nickel-responsive transcriptional regulator
MSRNNNGHFEENADRFGVSLPGGLLEKFDSMVKDKGYANRSLAVADLIRADLVEHHKHLKSAQVTAMLSLVYDHHKADVQPKLTQAQHDHLGEVIASLHVHLDHHHCLEIIVMRGNVQRLKKLADELIAAKGVQHGKFTVTSVAGDLSH